MILKGRILSLQKRGNAAEETDDAFSPSNLAPSIILPFSCAIADGASESSFSGRWAKLLADHFVACEGDVDRTEAGMHEVRAKWHESVSGKPLPWYAEQKLAQGAFSTLLGVTVCAADEPRLARWHAFAVGDCCLFHVSASGDARSFPVVASQDFDSWPYLVSTDATKSEPLDTIGHHQRGRLETGEKLVLVSDALAVWVLRALEQNSQPFSTIEQVLNTANSFAVWVEALRDSGDIKNDDCTLLWLEAREEAS